jgi:transcriptional regulator with XRE-family HTH domain
MNKVTPNGTLIKKLREQLETGSLQKKMAHAVRISERMLRSIENKNAAIPIATLDLIANYLECPTRSDRLRDRHAEARSVAGSN